MPLKLICAPIYYTVLTHPPQTHLLLFQIPFCFQFYSSYCFWFIFNFAYKFPEYTYLCNEIFSTRNALKATPLCPVTLERQTVLRFWTLLTTEKMHQKKYTRELIQLWTRITISRTLMRASTKQWPTRFLGGVQLCTLHYNCVLFTAVS